MHWQQVVFVTFSCDMAENTCLSSNAFDETDVGVVLYCLHAVISSGMTPPPKLESC